ncbi:MAG: phosphatidylinositol-3-phosphatase [Thermoanaerobaculia bacterium]|jgi:acid phosphatase|nr:phosphatidylinositol-3-phosphatase [Thermoanaerobaculia bacterium]
MKLYRVRAFVLVLALCVPEAVLAWNGTGHQLVAAIAWDNMTPVARQNAFAILNAASNNICLRQLFPAGDLSTPEQQRQAFIVAATWPDKIRNGPCSTALSHTPWHFTDHFWQGVSGGSDGDAPQDATQAHPDPDQGNAVGQLVLFRPLVACAQTPCVAADERAEDLAWTLHLVGDIHQPLHSAARVSPANPNGDRGGNFFHLGPGTTKPLHTFWDDIVDTAFPRNGSESLPAYVDRAEAKIVHDHPPATMTGRLEPGDFAAWSREGFETAERVAYPSTLPEHHAPSAAYKQMVFATADEAIALGGYRLADLLNTTLGGQGVVPPPPAHLPVPSHIVIVIDENKSFGNVIGPAPKAPFINALAARGALLNFFALHHPSQPNYMELFAGQRLGVCADECPIGPFTAQNLGAALIAAGKTFVGFAENLPAQPRLACSGLFRAKHAPWVDFSNIPASASKDFATDFPTTPAGFDQLPDVSFVIPNMINDMHNGSGIAAQVATGNNWLRNNLSAYADWAVTHNSLLIVTWDEDSKPFVPTCPAHVITKTPPDNHIATIIMGEPVRSGQTPIDQYTHHDLLRTILDIYGIAPFAGATTAKDITGIWK